MSNNTLILLFQPDEPRSYALTELLRNGAKALSNQAVEAELEVLLAEHSHQTVNGQRAVIRNSYLPKRTIQTGLGAIDVQIPKVRDRSKQSIKFNSALISPYLKRTENIDERPPVLYLKGISTVDFSDALTPSL